MPVNTNSIMSNDSLAASLFQGHDYNRSLVGDSLVQQSMEWEKLPDAKPKTNHIGEFFDGVANFLADLPTFVYVIFGVVLAACLAYWMVKSGLFYSNPVLAGDDVEEGPERRRPLWGRGEGNAGPCGRGGGGFIALLLRRTAR